ncbi:MAG: PLP-dependent transferase [Pseudomonadota bacterium]
MRNMTRQTFAAQAGGHIDSATGAVVPPIHVATTFEREADTTYAHGLIYSRDGHPSAMQCEAVISELEGGAETRVFASGLAAATTLFQAIERPCHVIAPQVMYWSLRNWLKNEAPTYGIDVTFVDTTNTGAISDAVQAGRTKLIWLETPSNPTWSISDIAKTAEIAKRAGAALAVDSTAASPVCSNPLALGADVVMHSATKYLNGHSDVLAGSLTFAKADALFEHSASLRTSQGAMLGPFECALLLRGMRTVYVRVAQQCTNAMAIAERFAGDKRVAAVHYPGLPQSQGHDIARAQMPGGFGGMLSIRCSGGRAHAIETAAKLEIWKRATSLGGVESLVEHRASIEGPGTPCPDDLLRLSTGIESADDLIADLDTALG